MKHLLALKVLLIEDNPGDVLLLRSALEADRLSAFTLTHVERLDEGLKQLQQAEFDIVMADLGLPDSSGLQTFERIHQANLALPVVVFSGNEDEQQAIDAVRAGAQDYLVKSLSGFEIAARTIRYAVERHKLQLTLLESEERYRLLFNAIPNAIVFTDLQYRILSWNPAAEKMYGWTDAQAVRGKPMQGVVDPEYIRQSLEEVEKKLRVQGEWADEVIHRRQDGTPFPVLASGTVVKDHLQREVGYVAINMDITERKKAEAEIAMLARFPGENPNPVLRVNRDGIILNANQASALILKSWGVSIGKRVPENWYAVLRQTVQNRQIQELILECDGRVYSMQVTPIANEDYVNIYGNDITERTRAEKSLRQRMEDLALINALNEAVNRGASLIEITERLATETKKIFGSLSASIYLLDRDKKHLVLQHYTMAGEIIERLEKLLGRAVPQIAIPLGGDDHFNRSLSSDQGFLITGFDEVCVWLADFTNTTFFSEKIRTLMRKIIPAATRLLGINSVITLPLAVGRDILGVIELVTTDKFDETVLERLQNVRQQLAEVILRKQAEEHLRESEERYRLLAEELEQRVQERTAEVQDLYDNAPNGYHSLDANGTITMVNQTELNWLGYAREELVGIKTLRELCTPKSQKTFDENFPRFKEQGWISSLEFEVIRKDGSIFPVLLNATAIRDENGNLIRSRFTLFDITERKYAEDALRESKAGLQYFFDTASDLIQSMDENGNYQYVNNAWCRTLGYTAEEALQITMMNIIDPDHQEHCQELLNSLVVDQHPRQLEVVFRNKAGEPVIVEGSVSSRKNNNGHIATNGIFRNITERKRVEEILLASEAQLRQSRDELSIANAALEKASRLKDEFLASMSHELRTPLTGILGLSEALQLKIYGEMNDKQKNALKMIEDSGRHLLELINDILDLSKIEAGQMELHFNTFPLEDLCQASLKLTNGMSQQKGQKVSFTTPAESVMLHADARRVKQIIVNLLSNAIKFTPENGELGLEVQANAPEKYVKLIVWDKGIGIKAEDLQMVFTPFTQIDSSLAREYSGTGLGLSLVQQLVELHTGSVEVESVFGEGSRFTVTLPWRTENMPASEIEHPLDGQSTPVLSAVNNRSPLIMIADDNKLVLEILTDFLVSERYRVINTHSGMELLLKVAEAHPDLILVDIQMPGMDGLETIRRIRAHQDLIVAKTPIIAITALAMAGDRERCLDAGANEYMSKPVKLKEMVAHIQNLIEK
jgi:PAS domain S-box-containing protein